MLIVAAFSAGAASLGLPGERRDVALVRPVDAGAVGLRERRARGAARAARAACSGGRCAGSPTARCAGRRRGGRRPAAPRGRSGSPRRRCRSPPPACRRGRRRGPSARSGRARPAKVSMPSMSGRRRLGQAAGAGDQACGRRPRRTSCGTRQTWAPSSQARVSSSVCEDEPVERRRTARRRAGGRPGSPAAGSTTSSSRGCGAKENGVELARDVAAGAGVGVVAPGAADVVGPSR